MNTLGIFVKHPQPGRVKTRLAADVGDEPAAELYAAFVRDLLERFRGAGDRRLAGFTPDTRESQQFFRTLCEPGFDLWPQPAGDLGERMAAFFEHAFAEGAERVVLIGSDSPTLPADYVRRAFAELSNADCVLGPATDGGYALIGMRRMIPSAFERIAWSEPQVLEQTVRRLCDAGCSLRLLPAWYDVDSLADVWFLRGHLRGLAASGEPIPAPRTAELLDALTLPGDPAL